MKSMGLLVVEDDPLVIQSLRLALPPQWQLLACQDPAELPARGYHAALVDIHLTSGQKTMEGLKVIEHLNQNHANLEIIAMSGDLDRHLMEKCLRAGASRFLAKPLSLDELVLTLNKIEALSLLQKASTRRFGLQWIGHSLPSQDIRRQIAQLRDEAGPILIEGESGTGKEVAAQLIQVQDERGPFVIVNVASIPDNLFESEFFGHIKGAFTGADQNKIGLAEAAHGGDLFLDEIEALSLPHQAKLLRFLESGEVRRVGAREVQTVETRVIAATNRNLRKMVAEGSFREDLLWRLSGKKLTLPPLRERPEDVAELARYFLNADRARRKELAPDAIEALTAHTWPGNARELKRVCEQLSLDSPLPLVRREDVLRILRPAPPSVTGHASVEWSRGLATLVNDFEAQLIRQALENHQDIDECARTLQISRSSLYKKIKDHNIAWRSE